MKAIFFCLILFSGCKLTSAFLSPNEVHKEKVILLFRDQSKLAGEINILHENYNSEYVTYNEFIQFTPDGKDSSENISLYNIAGYWFESDFYALKNVDIQMTNVYRLLFVKRLTSDKSKIQLYELYESGISNNTGETRYSYYLSLPSYGPLETVNTRSNMLIPYFDHKMSLIVSDCPILAQKILAKENGYFIPMASFNLKTHPDVLLRIINEYNKCND
jgi:hypothetical protein